jgi:hypothetical protein
MVRESAGSTAIAVGEGATDHFAGENVLPQSELM